MTVSERDRHRGCFLGLALGDALGAPYESGPLERLVWAALGAGTRGHRWSDDTQMTMDVITSILEYGDVNPDALARQFAASYRWHRGYGPGAARILKRIRRGVPWAQAARAVYPDGSFGNGAAMRAPVLAVLFPDADRRDEAARQTAIITHAHPEGVDGAVLTAAATRGFLEDWSTEQILHDVTHRLQTDIAASLQLLAALLARDDVTAKEIASTLGNGMTVRTSCPTALYLALRFQDAPFSALLDFAIACRGDVDTIAAMAGAMWGAKRGAAALPTPAIERWPELVALSEQLADAGHRGENGVGSTGPKCDEGDRRG